MNVREYADYVIDNIAKVSSWKTLNITNKVLENYDVNEFITALYLSVDRVYDIHIKYRILIAINEARNLYESLSDANKALVTDINVLHVFILQIFNL